MLDRFNAALNEFDPFVMDGDIAAADEVLDKLINHLCDRPALTDEQKASIARLRTKAELCASYALLMQDRNTEENSHV